MGVATQDPELRKKFTGKVGRGDYLELLGFGCERFTGLRGRNLEQWGLQGLGFWVRGLIFGELRLWGLDKRL